MLIFFHPDYTVGFGISPNHALRARGLYRRSGISPCPEDCFLIQFFSIIILYTKYSRPFFHFFFPLF